ncbi:MAG: PIN domain-containing protein [Deltaproteobacteria bacterium]|nr:PIN domain-containing protein [Deltaproteobacteria bacterium]
MFCVDTNVLLYALNPDVGEHQACWRLLERLRAQRAPWFTTWGILYEVLRVSTHPRVFTEPLAPSKAWSFVESILASPGLQILTHTERHAAVAAEVLKDADVRGNAYFDAQVAVLMREHGVSRILTRDVGFHRFRFLDVIDPLVA